MNFAHARLRYLGAMGLLLPGLSGCKESASPTTTATTTATATTTTTTTTTATATTTTTATATAPIPLMNMPVCPNGVFCDSEPKGAPKSPAAAPYAKCESTATHPDDRADAGARASWRSVSFSDEDTAAARAKTPNACCYRWVTPCPGGRALRDESGAQVVASTIERDDWTARVGALAIDPRAAEHWMREAALEHASIASFSRLTLDLLALGAPPELLELTQRAAIDEIAHARVCFAIASAFAGRDMGPGPLAAAPRAAGTLAELVRSTFEDGCVGESVASAVLAERARGAEASIAPLLVTMSEDEARHAELAWRIVAWAVRIGGDEAARALVEARDRVVDELRAFERDGATGESALRAAVLAQVVVPCARALTTQTPATRGAPATA